MSLLGNAPSSSSVSPKEAEGGARPRRLRSAWDSLRRRCLTRRGLVAALGWLWVLDGLLQLQSYMYTNDFVTSVLQYQTMGKPNVATELSKALILFTFGTPGRQALYNTLAAVAQLGIGSLLILGRMERLALAGSFFWGLVPWLTGEGLGGMIFPQASMAIGGAPGPAFVYSLLSLILWPKARAGKPLAHGVAEEGLLGDWGARLVWSSIWVGTGFLELERSNWAPDAVGAQLATAASGEPGWLASLDRSVAHLLDGHGTVVAFGLMAAQTLVGWWVLRRRTLRLALVTGAGLSMLYWGVGQNFGGLLTGQATDPSLGPVMVLLTMALWPRNRMALWPGNHAEPSPAAIEEPSAWSWLASVRRSATCASLGILLVGGSLVGAARAVSSVRAADRSLAAGELRLGRTAPPGSFVDLSGARRTLAGLKRPVLLWFVATWCDSCEAETKTEVARSTRLLQAGVTVVELDLTGDASGLDLKDTLAQMRKFARPFQKRLAGAAWTWGVASKSLTETYDPEGHLDQFYLIGTDGRVRARGLDPASWSPGPQDAAAGL